jgi:hypothetical protein
LDVYEPVIRLLRLKPSKVAMRPLASTLQPEASSPTCDEAVEISVATSLLPESRGFLLTLTDQRDSGRTLQFPGDVSVDRRSVTARVPGDLLRPRDEEDARVFDVFLVVDGKWRSDNRRILSVLTDEDLASSDDQ